MEFENNALFWQKLDTIYLSSDFAITNKKGSYYNSTSDLQYPCTFGFLKTLSNEKDGAIPCFKGSASKDINAVVILADILLKSISVIMLVGCTDKEEEEILNFLNHTDYQKAVLLRRSDVVPSWGLSDD